jgi:hypothetical protein
MKLRIALKIVKRVAQEGVGNYATGQVREALRRVNRAKSRRVQVVGPLEEVA